MKIPKFARNVSRTLDAGEATPDLFRDQINRAKDAAWEHQQPMTYVLAMYEDSPGKWATASCVRDAIGAAELLMELEQKPGFELRSVITFHPDGRVEVLHGNWEANS